MAVPGRWCCNGTVLASFLANQELTLLYGHEQKLLPTILRGRRAGAGHMRTKKLANKLALESIFSSVEHTQFLARVARVFETRRRRHSSKQKRNVKSSVPLTHKITLVHNMHAIQTIHYRRRISGPRVLCPDAFHGLENRILVEW